MRKLEPRAARMLLRRGKAAIARPRLPRQQERHLASALNRPVRLFDQRLQQRRQVWGLARAVVVVLHIPIHWMPLDTRRLVGGGRSALLAKRPRPQAGRRPASKWAIMAVAPICTGGKVRVLSAVIAEAVLNEALIDAKGLVKDCAIVATEFDKRRGETPIRCRIRSTCRLGAVGHCGDLSGDVVRRAHQVGAA